MSSGIDKECEGPGATHFFACKCREAHFAAIEVDRDKLARLLEQSTALLAKGTKMAEGVFIAVRALMDIEKQSADKEVLQLARTALKKIEALPLN